MEEHYIKDVGKITYVYGVNLEEHKMVIEKQQKRIAELEQELAKYKELQDQLGLENADEFEWFVMLDLLTDNEKNMHILDLHRELAELKQKAIVPKFKIGQEIYSVGYLDIQSWVVDRIELGIIDGELCEIYRLGHIGTDDYNCCILPQDNEKFYATLEEAQAKLQELRGEE